MTESILAVIKNKERREEERKAREEAEEAAAAAEEINGPSEKEKYLQRLSETNIDEDELTNAMMAKIEGTETKNEGEKLPGCNSGPGCKCSPDEIGEKNLHKTTHRQNSVNDKKPKLKTAFEFCLKVDFHDKQSNFYQLLSSEDEEEIQNTSGECRDRTEAKQEEVRETAEDEEEEGGVVENGESDTDSFISSPDLEPSLVSQTLELEPAGGEAGPAESPGPSESPQEGSRPGGSANSDSDVSDDESFIEVCNAMDTKQNSDEDCMEERESTSFEQVPAVSLQMQTEHLDTGTAETAETAQADPINTEEMNRNSQSHQGNCDFPLNETPLDSTTKSAAPELYESTDEAVQDPIGLEERKDMTEVDEIEGEVEVGGCGVRVVWSGSSYSSAAYTNNTSEQEQQEDREVSDVHCDQDNFINDDRETNEEISSKSPMKQISPSKPQRSPQIKNTAPKKDKNSPKLSTSARSKGKKGRPVSEGKGGGTRHPVEGGAVKAGPEAVKDGKRNCREIMALLLECEEPGLDPLARLGRLPGTPPHFCLPGPELATTTQPAPLPPIPGGGRVSQAGGPAQPAAVGWGGGICANRRAGAVAQVKPAGQHIAKPAKWTLTFNEISNL